MASYRFLYDGVAYGDHEVEFSFSNIENLDTVLEKFTLFLKGCGFHIEDGVYLDFVSEKGTPDWFMDEPNQPSAEFSERGKYVAEPKRYDFQPLDDALGLKVYSDDQLLNLSDYGKVGDSDTKW